MSICLKIKEFKSWVILVLLVLVSSMTLNSQIIWDPVKDVTSPSFGHNWPRISLNGNGDPVLIWGNLERVMFSKWDGTKFSQGTPLNPPGVTVAEAGWMGPEFCTYGDTIYVVYKESPENQEDKHVWCVSSFDGGESWNAPVRVDQTGADKVRFPVVTTDKDGHPIVGMMRSDETFHDPRWVVSRSDDFGVSFSVDTMASGWSGQRSEVCDCCPGSMDSDGDRVAIFYRDNLFDLRECWTSLSFDGGKAFSKGINVDGTGWMINSCPSSAIDGVIIGDSIYSAFMSGASGSAGVYFSRSSISQSDRSVEPIIKGDPDIRSQNYPRMDHSQNAVGVTWVQYSGDKTLIPIKFSPDIRNTPMILDTVALGNAENVDIAISNEQIFVVWKDPGGRALRYRVGRYKQPTATDHYLNLPNLTISPNPSDVYWKVTSSFASWPLDIILYNSSGARVFETVITQSSSLDLKINNANLPSGSYFLQFRHFDKLLTLPLIKL